MIRGILVILSWFYGAAVVLRNAAFRVGLLSVRKAGVPVISVGNLTAGGTGKTPLVEYLVGQCLSRNVRVAVISRGYGRTTRGVTVVSDGRSLSAGAETGGDEPVQIARKYPAAIVVVGERRVDAATRAVKDFGAVLVIMDDGFQHRYLHRDLDIVVVDIGKDIRYNPLLPRGTRREPLSSFHRAGVVMFSRVGAPEQLAAARRDLAPWFSGPVAAMTSVADGFRTLDGAGVDSALIHQGIGFAFCGIGEPEGFLTSLKAIGVRISAHEWYPDHHRFTERDMQIIRKRAAEHGASFLITTEKDAMRLQASTSAGRPESGFLPMYYLRIRVEMVAGAEEFHQLIETCCSTTKTINQ